MKCPGKKLETILKQGLLLTILIGCGGNDSYNTRNQRQSRTASIYSNNEQKTNSQKQIPIFLTDKTGSKLKHFWAKIHKVEIQTEKGYLPVFSSAKGYWVDLAHLKENGEPKTLFIGLANLNNNENVKRALITLDGQYYIQQLEGKLIAKELARNPGEITKKTYSIPLKVSEKVSELEPFLIDFDLGTYHLNSENKGVLDIGFGKFRAAEEPKQQIPTLLEGITHNSRGAKPTLIFTLNMDHGPSMQVETNLETAIFDLKGEVNPFIGNGKNVSLRGIYQVKSKSFQAQAIALTNEKIENHKDKNQTIHLAGLLSQWTNSEKSFEFTPKTIFGMSPINLPLKLNLEESTLLLSENGKKLTKVAFNKMNPKGKSFFIEARKIGQNIQILWMKEEFASLKSILKPKTPKVKSPKKSETSL